MCLTKPSQMSLDWEITLIASSDLVTSVSCSLTLQCVLDQDLVRNAGAWLHWAYVRDHILTRSLGKVPAQCSLRSAVFKIQLSCTLSASQLCWGLLHQSHLETLGDCRQIAKRCY